MVNDSDYGLQTGIFTTDLNRAFYAFDHLEVGGVVINEVSAARVDSMPVRIFSLFLISTDTWSVCYIWCLTTFVVQYGGIKDSGFGREGIKFAIQELTEPKILLLKDIGKL